MNLLFHGRDNNQKALMNITIHFNDMNLYFYHNI